MKYLLAALSILCYSSFAQPSDFIILKKNKKPVQYFYAGSQISFVSTSGAYRNALINAIKNDSIYLQEFLVQRVPTIYGSFILDTVGSFRFIYHYNQVKNFGKEKNKGFNVAGSGAALLGGGILLTVASAVSFIADKEKFSPQLLGASVILGSAGYFMSRSGKNGMEIGKKYSLHYMNMSKN
jgi:hypothetical protein